MNYYKPDQSEIKNKLSKVEYYVTQQDGTEPPYVNRYWNNKAEGIYVDIVSGEPLFSSFDKYDSGTGWPSFTKPLDDVSLVEKEDHKLFATRTEVRSSIADSHLGHVFPDGPTSTSDTKTATPTGKRYCMNSAALRFIAKEDLESEGYGEYLTLFDGKDKA